MSSIKIKKGVHERIMTGNLTSRIYRYVIQEIKDNGNDLDTYEKQAIKTQISNGLDDIDLNSGYSAGKPMHAVMSIHLGIYITKKSTIENIGDEIVSMLQSSSYSDYLLFDYSYNTTTKDLTIRGQPTHMGSQADLVQIIKALHSRVSRLESSISNSNPTK